MTSHEVTYQGPSSFAVRAATLLADADGVELTSATPPEHASGSDATVLLTLLVEGTAEAVAVAADSVRVAMPPEATVTVDEPVDGP